MNRPLAIDLFAGCGGLSLGLEAAGFDVVGAVEIDPIHALVHEFNFPYGVTLCQDITQVNSVEFLAKIYDKCRKNKIDLIAGGPPCQGFSMMGKRLVEDPRNQLVFEYLRLIREIQPKYFIFENVAGMAAGKHKNFLKKLLEEFKNIGYCVVNSGKVLDASLYGAAQRRKRLFMIGYRQGETPINYPQAIFSPSPKNINLGPKKVTTVKQVLADLEAIAVHQTHDLGIPATQLNYDHMRTSFAIANTDQFSLCHHRHSTKTVWGHVSSKHTQKTIQRFRATMPGTIDPISRFLRLDPNGLANTLRAGTPSNRGAHTAPRPIHYAQPRCISIREAARLHTFPDWFQFHRTIWHGFREIGNSVVPLLGKYIADDIVQALGYGEAQLSQGILNLPQVSEKYLSYTMGEACHHWQIDRSLAPRRTRAKVTV